MGGPDGACGACIITFAADCWAGCNLVCIVGFGDRALAGSLVGIGFVEELVVHGMDDVLYDSGGAGCFPFPLDTSGVGT